ncbi:MAG: glycosyltransferase family 2 protein [Candidatus ainarchaeum sp.]|nr:glycosyltransferase family 2 protein [Candidatus ainarchaeum sp.]
MAEMTVIVPTRNEAECVEGTLGKIARACEKARIDYEILVMDDGSKDGTKDIVAGIAAKNGNVRLINRSEPYGFGYSIRDGIRMASGKYAAIMMADLSDDPGLLPKIKERMDKGCDAVVCSRFMKGSEVRRYPFLKMASNRLFNWTVGIVFNLGTGDASNAYKCFRVGKAKGLPVESRGFQVSAEILIRMKLAGARICEIPASWEDRSAGEAKFRLGNTFISYFVLFLKMFKLAYLGGKK